MNDIATQIETNNKIMMILFDERKEMILELMAMVEEIQTRNTGPFPTDKLMDAGILNNYRSWRAFFRYL